MKTKALAAVIVALMVLSLSQAFQLSFAQTYDSSYQLLDQQGENPAYTLNVIVSETLLQHYESMGHRLSSLTDFPHFVTPDALKPIADCLRQIYTDDEDFVNGALQIVHQMTYVETQKGKYPVETLVDNTGDCDIFSYVAASIIEAGNLSVVLLDYEAQKHMNIGVHLATPPEKARTNIFKITHDDVDYYIAETTGGNWTNGWQVGECPDNMKAAAATVLTLENDEQISPGQVSASFKKLADSALSLQMWPPIAVEKTSVTLKGALSPSIPDENVTIYLGVTGYPWTPLSTVQTKADGTFEYTWKAETAGMYAIRAIWTGTNTYAGATTETIDATVIPVLVVVLIAVTIIAIIVAVIAVIAASHSRHQTPNVPTVIEPQPPTFNQPA
jgi:hypothetical protein